MQLKTIEIKKRSVTRTIMIPDFGESSWRGNRASEAKFYRFQDDKTVYKRGQLTIVFDLTGKPIEAWSYYTCLYAFAEPTEDHPNGRLIKNITGYGSYTGKHDGEAMWYFFGEREVEIMRKSYSRIYKPVNGDLYNRTRATKAYTSQFEADSVSAQWHYAAELLHCDYGTSPSSMRRELASNLRGHTEVGASYAASKVQAGFYAAQREAREASERAAAHADGLANGSVIDLRAQLAKAVV